ncbi:MAG: hypothetical protein EHM36_01980 [Deltaproteobacteria bacterium]|nr:MAG: hypothetical protein EHM36_01980 [Deltaproteobacteria bacterium]
MTMAKEVDVPDELKILLPELSKGVIVIGTKAYEMEPMTEGQLEQITNDMAKLFEDISNPDGKCMKCGKVVKYALPRKIFECPDDKEPLSDMSKAPMQAIIDSSKVPKWLAIITGLNETEIKAKITVNQIKHFAGLFWKQNFSDEGLPGESKGNFQKLLGMFGMGEEAKKKSEAAPPVAETSQKESQPH